MQTQFYVLVSAAASFLTGILLCWFVMRQRVAITVEAAVVRANAEVQIELALAKEKARALEEDCHLARANHAALKAETNQCRDALDAARDERALLTERASRVPPLEAQVRSLEDQHKASQEIVLNLSTSEAEKAQSLKSIAARLSEVQQMSSELERELATVSALLQESSERRATLEAEVTRLPVLEEKLGQAEQLISTTQQNAADLREASGRVNAELKAEREALGLVRAEWQTERSQREAAETHVSNLTTELAEMSIRLTAEREQSEEKLSLLLQAKESLTDQFKNLANEILEEKSKRFSEQNQTSLGLLLDPLKLKISEFQIKVEDVYVKEGKDRVALAEQVRQLMDLNQSLSQDAKNLTRALKGSSKTQGNWGELVLERVLEASGLRKGEEYEVQESHTRDDGSRAQPDVVIHLPEDRHLVVDAKVSLTAYEEFSTSEDDNERQAATKRHMESIRAHMRVLSQRNYQSLYHLKSLDFVLMFVPIEPAFMLAVSHDRELFMDAWERNVLLVSPSTLLFVVRTVAHLWRQEAQSRNAQDIAKRGAELYDKLVGFVEDLESLGNRLKQAQRDYDAAHNKLTSGRGNVIRQAEMLKDLGIKPSKALPAALVEIATDGAANLALADGTDISYDKSSADC
jgi:DNA recombination protein RmuC